MKVKHLFELMEQYGDLSISEIIKKKQGSKLFECPKCKGFGTETKVIRGEWGYTPDTYTTVDCPVCNGFGYTDRQLKPKTKTEIIGYE